MADKFPYPEWVTDPERQWWGELDRMEAEYFADRPERFALLDDLRLRLDLAMEEMPGALRNMFSIETGSTDGGIVLYDESLRRSRLVIADQNVGWKNTLTGDKANPQTEEPFRTWALVTLRKNKSWLEREGQRLVLRRWDELSPQSAEARMMALMEHLRNYGLTFYHETGSGAAQPTLYGTMDRNAPWSEQYDRLRDIGDYHPGMYYLDGRPKPLEELNPTDPGKANKRYQFESAGGEHTYGLRDNADPNVVHLQNPSFPARSEHIRVMAIDDATEHARDAYGNDVGRMSHSDGGGMVRASAARRIFRVTGYEPDGTESAIQTLGIIDKFTDSPSRQGWNETGVQKDWAPIVADDEFTDIMYRYFRAQGYDQAAAEKAAYRVDYVTSKEGAANQLSNRRVDRLRFIIHHAKPYYLDPRSASGTAKQPMLHRYFDLGGLADRHFGVGAADSYKALFAGGEWLDALRDRIAKTFPKGLDQDGELDKTDKRYLQRWRQQQKLQQEMQGNRLALETGSRYASPGTMGLSDTGPAQRYQSRRNDPKSLADLDLPVLSGKAAPYIAMAHKLRSRVKAGEIALVTERYEGKEGRTYYAHHFVFSDEDLDDPEHNWRHQGFDFDDEFKYQLAIDEHGEYYVLLDRAPHGIASGQLYRARAEDVSAILKQGVEPFRLRPWAELNSDEYGAYKVQDLPKLEAESPFYTEEYPRKLMQQIAWDLEHGTPRQAFRAKMRWAGVVTGESYVANIYNLSALIMRSGWVDGSEGLVRWVMNLSNALDKELVGTGNNRNMFERIAEAVVLNVIDHGAMLDRQVIDGQYRQDSNILAQTYATLMLARKDGVQLEELDNATAKRMRRKYQRGNKEQRDNLVAEWNELIRFNRGVTLQRWEEVNRRVAGAEEMAEMVEKILQSLSNGPQEWLAARTFDKKPRRLRRDRKWIHRSVRELALEASFEYARLYSMHMDYVKRLEADLDNPDSSIPFVRRDGSYIPRGAERREWVRSILENAQSLMWREVDRIVAEKNAQARRVDGYADGMFQAALVQAELQRNQRRNLKIETERYRTLSNRVFQAIDERDKAAYFDPKLTYKATLAIPWNRTKGENLAPWIVYNQQYGYTYDARKDGPEYTDEKGRKRKRLRRFSDVRYHPEENILGPTVWIAESQGGVTVGDPEGGRYRDLLRDLDYLGFEFVYTGDELGGRVGTALYEVKATKRYTVEQFERWAYARYVLRIDPNVLPPPWISPDKFQITDHAVTWQNASGNTVHLPLRVSDSKKRIRVGLWDKERWDFVDVPAYYMWQDNLVDHLRALGLEVPEVTVSDLEPSYQREPDYMDDMMRQPVEDLERPPEDLDYLIDDDIDDARVQAAAMDEARVSEPAGKRARPKPRPEDPVNRVGGQDNDETRLLRFFDEFRAHHLDNSDILGFVHPRSNRPYSKAQAQAQAQDPSDWRHITNLTDEGINKTAIFESESLGILSSSTEAAAAYEDLARWKQGDRSLLRTPGLHLARTVDEAASLIMRKLYLQSEFRLIMNREIGYFHWIDVRDSNGEWMKQRVHTREKTNMLHRRVAFKWNVVNIPTGIAGVNVTLRQEFRSYRRSANKLADWIRKNTRYENMPKLSDYINEEGKFTALATAENFHRRFFGGVDEYGEIVPDLAAVAAEVNVRIAATKASNSRIAARVELLKKVVEIDGKPLTINKRLNMELPAVGALQMLTELEDLRMDAKEIWKVTQGIFDRFEDDEVEMLAKIAMMDGLRNRMATFGVDLEPSAKALFRDDPSLVTRMPASMAELVGRSNIGKDWRGLQEVAQDFKRAASGGNWAEAASNLNRLADLHIGKFIKNNTRVYSQSGLGDPTVMRALGRVLIGGRVAGSLAYMDLDSAFGSREVNETVSRLKQGTGNLLWKMIQSFGKDWERKARQAHEKYKDLRWSAQRHIAMDLDLLSDTSDYSMRRRITKSTRTLIIVRVHWWKALTAGVGARYLSKALRKKKVPMEKKWVVKNVRDSDWVCLGNMRQGWLANDRDFRSGHPEPPAHPGCRCELEMRLEARSTKGAQTMLNRGTKPQFIGSRTFRGRSSRYPNPIRGGVLR